MLEKTAILLGIVHDYSSSFLFFIIIIIIIILENDHGVSSNNFKKNNIINVEEPLSAAPTVSPWCEGYDADANEKPTKYIPESHIPATRLEISSPC